MNGETKKCYPSLRTLSLECGLSVPTIRKSISCLVEDGWITIEKKGRSQYYGFTPYKNFEVFGMDFLKKENVSAKEKAYIIALQQYMWKDVDGFGKVSFTNKEISKRINLPEMKIEKYDKSLNEKGYLTLFKSGKKDKETGIFVNNKFFHLDELGQAVIFAIHNQGEKVENIDGRLITVEKTLSKTLTQLSKSTKELSEKDEIIRKYKSLLIENNIDLKEINNRIEL